MKKIALISSLSLGVLFGGILLANTNNSTHTCKKANSCTTTCCSDKSCTDCSTCSMD